MKKKNLPKISALTVLLFGLMLTVITYFSGCVAIPDHAYVVSGAETQLTRENSSGCEEVQKNNDIGRKQSFLDPDGFSILSWNTHKGSEDGFGDDLSNYTGKIDLLLLQEAALNESLRYTLDLSLQNWLMAVAFKKSDEQIGVISAGRTGPHYYCALRESEPLFAIPKMILVSTYPLMGVDQQLLVVNAHMVNFTITTDVVGKQLSEIARFIENHDGPVIVAGDFNTWSKARESMVNEEMSRLTLKAATFEPDNRSVFLTRAVDGIYYRGLEVTRSASHVVESSDHNPLEVHFRLLR